MVLCIECKHFVIISHLEDNMCDIDYTFMSGNIIYDDIPCDFYEPVDSNNSKD